MKLQLPNSVPFFQYGKMEIVQKWQKKLTKESGSQNWKDFGETFVTFVQKVKTNVSITMLSALVDCRNFLSRISWLDYSLCITSFGLVGYVFNNITAISTVKGTRQCVVDWSKRRDKGHILPIYFSCHAIGSLLCPFSIAHICNITGWDIRPSHFARSHKSFKPARFDKEFPALLNQWQVISEKLHWENLHAVNSDQPGTDIGQINVFTIRNHDLFELFEVLHSFDFTTCATSCSLNSMTNYLSWSLFVRRNRLQNTLWHISPQKRLY